ncbi:MAG: hypothetical protein KKA55_10385 [Proteobacteria bacterium]|nr:hypothetical protein [Pseudomonadota bacterium]MBU1595925.1 hypothetical protein [Pseudomonadota bacterium]
MSTSTLNAQTRAFGLSVAITSIVSALLVIAKESNEDTLLKFMKTVTPHHWITHGLFNLILFVALGLILAKSNNGQGPALDDDKLINVTAGGFLLSCFIIAGFFLIGG